MEAESTQTTETYLKLLAWLHANQKMLMIAAGVVVVAALGIGIMSWEKSQTEADADAKLLSVPLVTVHGGRLVPAEAAPFLDVAKQFPNTPAGEYGQLLGAEALFTEGKYPEAHQEFSKFVEEHSSSSLVAQAKVGVAASLEGEGKTADAAQKYQEIILAYGTEANIATPAKLTLARLDEQLNKPEQAFTYYQDLARDNNPNDPWSAEARERGMLLLMQHPELRKAAAPPTGTPKPTGGVMPSSTIKPVAAPTAAPAQKP